MGHEPSTRDERGSAEQTYAYNAMMFEATPAPLWILITKTLGARSAILGDDSREPSARAPP
jgi:hypothetical protein